MSIWTEVQRGDVWVSPDGKEHNVIGVVLEGFDALCDGVVENVRHGWVVPVGGVRTPDEDDENYKAVAAWTKKGA